MRPNQHTFGITLDSASEIEIAKGVLTMYGFERTAMSLDATDETLNLNSLTSDLVLQGLRKLVPRGVSGNRLLSAELDGDRRLAAEMLEDYETAAAFENVIQVH